MCSAPMPSASRASAGEPIKYATSTCLQTSHPRSGLSKGENECSVMLLEHLGARRQKHAAKLRAAVRQKGSKLRKRLKGISTEFEKLLPEASANVAGLAVKLSTELASPAGLNKRNLHPYRLKVKELRNVLQMGRQRRSTGVHRHAGRGKRCHRRVARLAGAHRNSRGYSRP